MVFLIEGMDGTGKTTAVDGLKMLLPDAVYIKESYPGDSLEERQNRLQVLKRRINSCEVFVYDRATALDEFVYEPIVGSGAPKLDWEYVKPILSQCLTIYFECDSTTIVDRLENRGDEYLADMSLSEVVKKVKTEYSRYVCQIPHVTIDVTDLAVEGVCDQVYQTILLHANMYMKKRPKLAHILPRDLLYLTADNQYHMCLAHLIISDKEYLAFYRRMVAAGRYVLMDNGAAENSQLSLEDLYKCWNELRPTELVLPDTLCDKDSTLEKTRDAVRYFRGKDVTAKFMAVPQGKTIEEWEACARQLIQIPEVHCLGVSKFLTIELKDPNIRYQAVEYISYLRKVFHREDVEVHLLGCDAGPSEPGDIFRDFGFVRGCDTALAYIFAQAGKPLEANTVRPSGEMSFLTSTLSSVKPLTAAMEKFNNVACVVNDCGDYTWF